MKKRIFALAGACLLTIAACSNPPPPNATGPGPVDECGPGPGPNGQPCP